MENNLKTETSFKDLLSLLSPCDYSDFTSHIYKMSEKIEKTVDDIIKDYISRKTVIETFLLKRGFTVQTSFKEDVYYTFTYKGEFFDVYIGDCREYLIPDTKTEKELNRIYERCFKHINPSKNGNK